MKTDKIKRLNKISEILKNKEVTTQEELVFELQKKGIKITQATLSRDLAEIGAIRVHSKNKTNYKFSSNEAPISSEYRSIVVVEVKSIQHNETLVVIKTHPGCAQSVAVVIDSWNHQDILSSVAGDDTILVIPKTCKNVKKIYNFMKNEWKI